MVERFSHTTLGSSIKHDNLTGQYFDARLGLPAGGLPPKAPVRRGRPLTLLRHEEAQRAAVTPQNPATPATEPVAPPPDGSKLAAQSKWGVNLGIPGISTPVWNMSPAEDSAMRGFLENNGITDTRYVSQGGYLRVWNSHGDKLKEVVGAARDKHGIDRGIDGLDKFKKPVVVATAAAKL